MFKPVAKAPWRCCSKIQWQHLPATKCTGSVPLSGAAEFHDGADIDSGKMNIG
jgi:hypothetical protein